MGMRRGWQKVYHPHNTFSVKNVPGHWLGVACPLRAVNAALFVEALQSSRLPKATNNEVLVLVV